MSTTVVQPNELQKTLDSAKPNDTILLRGGDYVGEFNLRTADLTLQPYENEPVVFRGPVKYVAGDKPAWLHVFPSAKNTKICDLAMIRSGDIAKLYQAGWNDYGIVVEAANTEISNCTLKGMAKAIHVKGAKSTGGTIVYNSIGPTIDSNFAIGSSLGVVRGMLIAYNVLDGSYREDGIQFSSDPNALNKLLDISNMGTIIYKNVFRNQNENGVDLKAAGKIIIADNEFQHIAGSNNGAPDWNFNSRWTISLGAIASSGQVLARNNLIHDTCGGIRLDSPDWIIIHNEFSNNNWRPEISNYKGFGIRQPGKSTKPQIVNNLAYGNLEGDFLLDGAQSRGNRTTSGAGVPLAKVTANGSGVELPLDNAGYFTDWFGRSDLPKDILWLNNKPYNVQAVDWGKNTVTLDQEASWAVGDLVTWRSPDPVVGIQEVYVEPTEPPIDPPIPPIVETELVQLMLEASFTSAEAAQLRALLKDKSISARLV